MKAGQGSLPQGGWVTSLSLLHPAGQSLESFWRFLCQGELPQASQPGMICLRPQALSGFLSEDQARRMDRVSQILAVTARAALAHAGPGVLDFPEQVGMCLSTDLGTLDSIIRFSQNILRYGPSKANPLDFTNTVMNAPAGHTCILTGMKGHNNTVSGSGALGEALDVLALGRAQGMLAAGVEECSCWQQQSPLLRLAPSYPAPLSRHRDGCWLGEGAACLLLETMDRVAGRKADVYARYLSHAETFDAGPGRDAAGFDLGQAAMTALDRARLHPGQIQGIVVSCAGQSADDARAAQALQLIFGERLAQIPVFAFAGALGHLAGAAEVFGAACACLALKTRTWPASPWFQLDPDLPELCVLKESRPFMGEYIISLTSDWYGVNAAHVFARAS